VTLLPSLFSPFCQRWTSHCPMAIHPYELTWQTFARCELSLLSSIILGAWAEFDANDVCLRSTMRRLQCRPLLPCPECLSRETLYICVILQLVKPCPLYRALWLHLVQSTVDKYQPTFANAYNAL